MRTVLNIVVTIVNVFGFGQGRVVVSSLFGSCAHAAQHLDTRRKRARAWTTRKTRRWPIAAAAAATARWAELSMSLAMVGPQRMHMRQLSPVLVQA